MFGRASRRGVAATAAGIASAIALAGCGGGARTVTTARVAASSESSTPDWQPGTPAPTVTGALIAHAGFGLSRRQSRKRPRSARDWP
jgi:hypothetical protein